MSILPYRDRAASSVVATLLQQLLPSTCLLCGGNAEESVLCAGCIGDLPELPDHTCPHCSEPTTHGERCGACLKDPPHFARTFALYRYDFPADRLVHALKYGHQLALAAWFGQRLGERIAGHAFDAIIPLPLHPNRLRERGFNQSGEIARQLQIPTKIPVDRSSLLRTRETPPQAELPLKARHKNVRGAFECRTDFTGRRILLVDDVMTTGATANECARVLRLHGAAEVSVAVVARALKN
jgi:ComF family protein